MRPRKRVIRQPRERYKWLAEYSKRHDADYLLENQRWLEELDRTITRENNRDLDEGAWALFFKCSTDRDSPMYEDERVLDFGKTDMVVGVHVGRTKGRALTSAELFEALMKMDCCNASGPEPNSFALGGGHDLQPQDAKCDVSADAVDSPNLHNDPDSAQEPDDKIEPDVERRVVCMYNPDALAIHALAVTVSGSRYRFVPQVIRDYIHFTPALQCRILPSIFSLHFNFSFYVWRRSTHPLRDDRFINGEGRPERLRKFWNMSFLAEPKCNEDGEREFAFAYEVGSACLLMGQDDTVWDAYGLFDSYFEKEEYRRDFDYYREIRDEDGLAPDLMPLDPRGESFADFPIWKPREYFAVILESRVRQMERETTEVVHRVRKHLQDAEERNFRDHHCGSRNQKQTPAQRNENVRKMTNRTREFLTFVIRTHRRNTQQLEDFLDGPIGYFTNLEHPQATQKVEDLRELFSALTMLQRSLEELQEDCNRIASEFKMLMQTEDNEKLDHAQQDSKVAMPILLVSTVLFFPLSLTANLFNVPDILNFPTNGTNYMIANAVFIPAAILLVLVIRFLSTGSIQRSLWRFILNLSGISSKPSSSEADDLDACGAYA